MSSLAEIARICGVSVGATSKALNGKTGVSEATRQKILETAAQRSYRPNRLVHAIQSGRSMTVGLTCNDFQGDFSGRIMEGMLEKLYGAGYDAIVINWDLCVHDGEKVLRTFAERRVDGLLMFPPADQPSPACLHELQNFHRPIVIVDQTFFGGEKYDFVGSQDLEGAILATEHLINLGHTKIANLCHLKTSTGRARFEGFQTAMARQGIPVREEWVREIKSYGSDEPSHHARELLTAENAPTAILAFNDWVALDAMATASDLGIKVPEELSLVGFADLRAASRVRPQLTTIAQDPVEIGRLAATRLLSLLTLDKTGEAAAGITGSPILSRVPVRMVVRQSTGTAPESSH